MAVCLSPCVSEREHVCVCVKISERQSVRCFGGAPLISAKAFIVSSGRGADEELYRRREEREEKEKLVRDGRC